MRLSEALQNNETAVIEPTKGIRLSEALSEEQPEFEFRALTQEMIANSVGMTEEQEKAYRTKKNIELIKKYPKDFYSGTTAQIEAFAQGLLPIRPVEFKRPGVEEAHPIATAVGKVSGLITTGAITAGVGPAVTYAKQLASLPTLARFAAGRMAQSGVTFGLKELADNMARIVGGEKKDFQTVTKDTFKATGFGAGLGATGAIASPVARIPAQAAYGYMTSKMGGSTNLEAGVNAGIFAVFGFFNTKNLNVAYKEAAYAGAKQSLTDRLIASGTEKEKAAMVADRYFRYALHKADAMKAGKPQWDKIKMKDLDTFSKAMRKGWKIIVEPEVKPTEGVPAKVPAKVAPVKPEMAKKAVSVLTPAKKPTVIKPPKPPQTIVPKGAEGAENEGKQVAEAYEKQKDIWFGKKDVRVHKSKVEKTKLQTQVKTALGKTKYDIEAQKYDKAIQLYIDTKRNPANLIKYYNDLSSEQKELVDISQSLPPKVQAIADKVSKSYNEIGLEAQEADVIKNVLDNYVNRTWDLTPKQSTTLFRKFGTTTPHAKQRVFDTILEGWAKGYKLKVEGATNNLQILKEELVKTLEDKRFLKSLMKLKTIDGEDLISTKQLEGYKRIDHPNFKVWRYAGKAEPGKVYGKNMFVTDEGTLMERKELYAPEAQAENLNNILGTSKLKGIKWVDALTKFNANTKAMILQSSFFHHMAFMRSYWFGTQGKTWDEMSPRQAYRQGLEAIEQENPIIELGVKNGLTLGVMQDWNEELLREKGAISNFLDKNKVTGDVKDKVMALRQQQADFLFGKFGAGLKAKSFMIEYRNLSKKHPKLNADEIAKMAANLINDDFGGLNLQRMGRNPTVQHIFRLVALAPDWTESNIRTMVKAVKAGGKEESAFYRKFWAGIFTKAIGLTVASNLLMAGFDEDDSDAQGAWERFIRNYKNAWKEGKFRWMDVDITPLYRAMGGKSEDRKYFSILGHFKDPLKFILHPIRSAHHKGSVVYKFFHEALVGADWAGRKFTTVSEVLGIDPADKKKKKKGKTVSWSFKGAGPLKYEQVPSFMVSQIKGWMPIQIQNLINYIAGEMAGFDAIAKSLGMRVSTTYTSKNKKKKGRVR